MANDDEIIVRTLDFNMSPDVEHYIQTLSRKGILEKLSKEGNLNVSTIKSMPLGRICDIFVEDAAKKLSSGDIIIFGDTATFEVFAGGSG